jgi:hypothetical protein
VLIQIEGFGGGVFVFSTFLLLLSESVGFVEKQMAARQTAAVHFFCFTFGAWEVIYIYVCVCVCVCVCRGTVVEALRYKPEGRAIDSRLC